MDTLRISAFSDGDTGGNPAGVCLSESLPADSEMQETAADIGYSETVFACPADTSAVNRNWRVRYFSPQSEVPFCGHATIALGAALASHYGNGIYNLSLNNASITVEGQQQGGLFAAALQSPSTRSKALADDLLPSILNEFKYSVDDLDSSLPAAWIHAGADHVVVALNCRKKLAAMVYPFESVKALMNEAGIVTIMFVYAEGRSTFHSRNAFASGGVVEDPATGAATAAFAGYLRDINWPHNGRIEIVQGEDMGSKSRLMADISEVAGSSIRVSGTARFM